MWILSATVLYGIHWPIYPLLRENLAETDPSPLETPILNQYSKAKRFGSEKTMFK